jgi:hypothetical protein
MKLEQLAAESKSKIESSEKQVFGAYGSIVYDENVAYAITEDDERGVPIPTPLAENISILLRLQNKVMIEHSVEATHVFQTFNCRKSVLVASGALGLEESITSAEIGGGEEQMFADIERLMVDEEGGVVALKDYAKFEDVLDTYIGSFPCIVHVFESDVPIEEGLDVGTLRALHRAHSFLVLGEDDEGYVCFQKVGPKTDQPFTITDLNFITHLYRNQKNRIGYFVYGPYR